MKAFRAAILFCLVISFYRCNEDPDICLESQPMALVYSILDLNDTVNYVILTKLFSGDNGGVLTNAKIWDSIYFNNAKVKVVLKSFPLDSTADCQKDTILLTEETATGKKPGIFAYPEYKRYALHKNLTGYYGYSLLIQIPGYRLPALDDDLVHAPELSISGNLLNIRPDLAMFIRWERADASAEDLRVDFMVTTYKNGNTLMDTITLTQYGMIPHYYTQPYGQTSFTYKELLRLLNSKFTNNVVDYRKITNIKVTLTDVRGLGSIELSDYDMEYILPDNFVYNPNSLFLSKMGSKISVYKTGLKIDPSDMAIMNNDPEFAKFRFIQW